MKKAVIISLVLLAIALLGGGLWWKFFYKKKTTATATNTTTPGSNATTTPISTTDPNKGVFEKQFVLVNGKDLYYVNNNELLAVSGKMLVFFKSLRKTQKVNPIIFPVSSLSDLKSYTNNNKVIGKGQLESIIMDAANPNDTNALFSNTPLPNVFHNTDVGGVLTGIGGGQYITIGDDGEYVIHQGKPPHYTISSKYLLMVG